MCNECACIIYKSNFFLPTFFFLRLKWGPYPIQDQYNIITVSITQWWRNMLHFLEMLWPKCTSHNFQVAYDFDYRESLRVLIGIFANSLTDWAIPKLIIWCWEILYCKLYLYFFPDYCYISAVPKFSRTFIKNFHGHTAKRQTSLYSRTQCTCKYIIKYNGY